MALGKCVLTPTHVDTAGFLTWSPDAWTLISVYAQLEAATAQLARLHRQCEEQRLQLAAAAEAAAVAAEAAAAASVESSLASCRAAQGSAAEAAAREGAAVARCAAAVAEAQLAEARTVEAERKVGRRKVSNLSKLMRCMGRSVSHTHFLQGLGRLT